MDQTTRDRSLPFVKVKQHGETFYLVALSAEDIVFMSYVARRGVDEEEGAVQRVLNQRRIGSIRDFVLAGGTFATSIVLNWVAERKPAIQGSSLHLEVTAKCAQIIDGQHRVEGLKAALAKQPALAMIQLPVTLYADLSTTACADLFLAINTEQKPVPRSLVFDLYPVASDYIVDPSAVRAGDLAAELNENPASPYRGYIKFPGSPRGQKGLALSTVVSAVKPLVEEHGLFEQVGLSQLQMQAQFLVNFFSVLQNAYGEEWESPGNVFRMAAGFVGAIEFVKTKLVVHCNIGRDFTVAAIERVMRIVPGPLLRGDAVSGLQGRRAVISVCRYLEERFEPQAQSHLLKV